MSVAVVERFDPREGELLDERFRIVRRLGEGTYGLVYLVEETAPGSGGLKAAKVLKLFATMPTLREEMRQRFDREFECGQIQSPYLVRAETKGEVKGNPFFTMEYCAQGSAKRWSQQRRSYDEIIRFCQEVLYGLQALHQNGVVHRDLKPENILMADGGIAKLTDFGIAGYQNHRMTKKNIFGQVKDLFGTYAYIAPEQVQKGTAYKTMAPSADMFSFGVTVYEVVTGKLPFGELEDEADLGGYLRRAKEGSFTPIARHRPNVPSQLQTLIESCLQPDFRNRIQSTEQALSYISGGVDTRRTVRFDFTRDMVGLQVMHGEQKGWVYNLSSIAQHNSRGPITLGWLNPKQPQANDVGIKETQTSYISRNHATIERDQRRRLWIIKDGQDCEKNGVRGWHRSLNGTFVNSQEADANGVPFNPGDIISIGDTTLRVVTKRR